MPTPEDTSEQENNPQDQAQNNTARTIDDAKQFSDEARHFGEVVERAIGMAESESPQEEMTEHVRYTYQGAKFRIVSRPVRELNAVYIEKKRSCDEEWQHERKLGWEEEDQEESPNNK
mgnify:CR=1 FL=1